MVDNEKDVVVFIHNSLKPSLQFAKAAGRAVTFGDKDTFAADKEVLEKVQCRAIRMVSNLRSKT